MGEEAFYTNGVEEYQRKSRFPTLSRYRDLIEFLKYVFADGIVTDAEYAVVNKIERDILLEYELALEIYEKLPSSSPKKTAAKRLVDHLHRCNILMSEARVRVNAVRKSMGKDEKEKQKENQTVYDVDKILYVSATPAQADLINEVDLKKEKVEKILPQIRKNLASLDPEERKQYEEKLNALIDFMVSVSLEQITVKEMNRMLGLEKYFKSENVKTRV